MFRLILFLIANCLVAVYAFSQTIPEGTVTDIDGNVYKTVAIAGKTWMAENLKVSRYRNGNRIAQVTTHDDWKKQDKGAWCYYNNDSANGKIYGTLYNWLAVNDPRGLCPRGWHIPSDEEWKSLVDSLGGNKNTGGKLKATTLWNVPNEKATNSTGFSALPGGVRYYEGRFFHLGNLGGFWSSTEGNADFAWFRYFDRSSKSGRIFFGKKNGFSCRCVQDIKEKKK